MLGRGDGDGLIDSDTRVPSAVRYTQINQKGIRILLFLRIFTLTNSSSSGLNIFFSHFHVAWLSSMALLSVVGSIAPLSPELHMRNVPLVHPANSSEVRRATKLSTKTE